VDVGVGEGDEVLTSPMTFAATGEVIRYLGATPVLVDIDPVTLNIDAGRIEETLQQCSRARAIVPVHIAGLACEMDRIMSIAASHDLRVIEDAAHTLPTKYKGRTIGTIGDVTCFSFYSTKSITTGEGGMATTDDDRLARVRCRSPVHQALRGRRRPAAAVADRLQLVHELGVRQQRGHGPERQSAEVLVEPRSDDACASVGDLEGRRDHRPQRPRCLVVHGSGHSPGGWSRVTLDTPADHLSIRAAPSCHHGLAL